MPKSRILPVPYYAQNDNELWGGAPGSVQCCPTANAMLGFYLNSDRLKRSEKNGFAEPESYYKYLMELEGYTARDRGNHDAHTVILSKYFKIDSKWRMDLSPKDFTESIDRGFPVVCGLEYKVSGHIAIAVGYAAAGLLIHDPYGIRMGCSNNYERINPGFGEESGKDDGYSWSVLDRILFAGGGWGRIVDRVR
jgi:hypothetical protein